MEIIEEELTIRKNISETKMVLQQKTELFRKKIWKEKLEKLFQQNRSQPQIPSILKDDLIIPFESYDENIIKEEEEIHNKHIASLEQEGKEFYSYFDIIL